MGLFDSVRGLVGGDGDRSGRRWGHGSAAAPDHRDPTPTDFRNQAADAIGEWSELDLDFSLPSLVRLDEFAERERARLEVLDAEKGTEVAAEIHTGYTVRAGSYFGETLVRQLDCEWVERGREWAVAAPHEGERTVVDVFEVAAHSFLETPAFAAVAGEIDGAEALADGRTGTDAATNGERAGGDGSPARNAGAAGSDTAREDGTPAGSADDGYDPVGGGGDARAEMRATAESFAGSWGDDDLDFTPASLARLAAVAGDEWDPRFRDATPGGTDMDSRMYTKVVKQLGAYYGEVIVRHLDGQWAYRGAELVVAVPGDRARTEAVFDVAANSFEGEPTFRDRYCRLARATGHPVPDTLADPSPTDQPADPSSRDGGVEPSRTGRRGGGERKDSPGGRESRQLGADPPEEGRPDSGGSPPGVRREDPGDEAADPTAARDASGTGGDGSEPTPDPGRLGEPTAGGSETDPHRGTTGGPASGDPGPESAVTPTTTGTRPDGREVDVESVVEELADAEQRRREERVRTVEDLRADAAAFAATWPGYDLDFSPGSLERLDRLVAAEYDATGTDPAHLTARAAEAGGYFGEVVQRTLGGDWQADPTPVVVVRGRVDTERVDPVALALARFRGEGSFAEAYADVQRGLSLSPVDRGETAGSDTAGRPGRGRDR